MTNQRFFFTLGGITIIVIALYFLRIRTDSSCCGQPVYRWKFAIYTTQQIGDTGYQFNKMAKTGFTEYLGFKEIHCNCAEVKNPDQHSTKKSDTLVNRIPYDNFILDVAENKRNQSDPIQAKLYLFDLLNTAIPDYWIGTKWDFNGVTRQPKNGTIACGYFITNTLTDIGFEIQRIKLAQAPSSKMINALCINIKRFSAFEQLMSYLSQQPDNSIFIIGLDFHTGYLLKKTDDIFFLHSNYIAKVGVVKEKIQSSIALRQNKNFMIGNLTENTALIKQWIQ